MRVNKGDVITIARAPKWQVYWYNAKKKIFLTESFEKALKATSLIESTSTAILDVNRPWKKGETEVIAGLPATVFRNEPAGKLTSNAVRNIRYWQYLDKQLPRQCGEWLATCYAVPYLGGIPLRCKYIGTSSALLPLTRSVDSNLGDRVWLDTLEAHKETVPDSLFVIPKGYKEVRNITDLYLAQPLTKENPLIKDLLKNPAALFGSQ
ncbi:MAG: hypothetical protein JSS86_05080 [Cyanobacteria bacterium SZAS LIN-2]|nr:hypothetical protein [Cyanobacteria bacterium SZAS LIN-2]